METLHALIFGAVPNGPLIRHPQVFTQLGRGSALSYFAGGCQTTGAMPITLRNAQYMVGDRRH